MAKFRVLKIVALTALVLSAQTSLALAQVAEPAVVLLKIVTIKDDVVVGVPARELDRMGSGGPTERIAGELQRRGQMSVWQYASTKDSNGELVMKPLRQISIFSSGTARIEPYATKLKVMPAS